MIWTNIYDQVKEFLGITWSGITGQEFPKNMKLLQCSFWYKLQVKLIKYY